MTFVPLFVNGEGMTGGQVHHTISDCEYLGEVSTAPRYRFYSVRDEFPALDPVPADERGGVAVPGELYRVHLDVIRDRFMPSEPPELELGVIELSDGSSAIAVLLRPEQRGAPGIADISDEGGWRAHTGKSRPR